MVQPTISEHQQPQKIKRSDALDALRGIAVLAMILSGTIPFNGKLPAWMYHAQIAPPDYKFNPNLPGLTWVDLVFPLFIFALGAAIPLALSHRLHQGWKQNKIIILILKRGFLLASFAIVSQHLRPFTINDQLVGGYQWRFALVGFVILFLMFVQLPKTYPQWLHKTINWVGWVAAIIMLANIQYPEDLKSHHFSLERSDIILMVLANIVVFASLIWLLTINKQQWRLGILILLFPLLLSFNDGGWNTKFLNISALSWLFNFDYLKYLLIAIPATIVGDWLVSWLQITTDQEQIKSWNYQSYITLILLLLSINLTLLIGLQGRYLELTAIIVSMLLIAGYYLVKNPHNYTEIMLNKIYLWGCYLLILGLAFEPYQGGIKKDPATMSYLFTTTGMSIFILIILIIIIDIFQKQKYFQLFIDNGKNPMLAYVGFGNLVWPILELLHWKQTIDEKMNTAWLGFAKGLIFTLIVALVVSFFTRLKWFWKT